LILLSQILIGLVALLHLLFLVLEMLFWEKSLGLKVFGHKRDFARQSRILAMNQGLYNGFLAAGLIWGLIAVESDKSISLFFLTCVIVAGVFGAITASHKILIIQALPAVLALVSVLVS